jgi:hypothetical protein
VSVEIDFGFERELGMSGENWKKEFDGLYQRAVAAYQAGRTTSQSMFDESDANMLASIGATAQEIFDYVEDASYGGDPSFEDVLEVTAIRYEYFRGALDGAPPEKLIEERELPRKTDAVDGVSWLPRIIAKARGKLRGELPPDLMYGCGGDRPFLRRAGIRLPEFLTFVRDAGDDDQSIVDFYKNKLGK